MKVADLRALATAVEDMRKEQQERIDAAKQAAAEIEQLAAQVRGDDPTATDPEVEEPPARETAAAEPETAPAPQQVSASSSLVKRINLASVRASQPRVLPEPPAPGTQLTAAVDVPSYTPGAPLDFGQVVTGIISRANALKTAGGGTGQVISYRHPFQQELIVTDSSSAPEGTTVAIAAQNQGRLP